MHIIFALTKFNHMQEKTNIYKSRHGWTGETHCERNGKSWVIHTSKTNGGHIFSNARAVQDEGNGNYSFVMFGAPENENFTLINEAGTGTENKIREAHGRALQLFDEKLKEMPAEKRQAFTIEKGQILFTDGNGAGSRRAVIEVMERGRFKTVLLDASAIRTDDHVRDFKDKFGIGVYYRQGDTIPAEEVDALVIKANTNIEEQNTAAQIARTEAATKRAADIETGSKIIAELPDWVKTIIVGRHETDTSDMQTDYFASSTDKEIFLAFSSHDRDLFPEMRKAADNCADTQHIGTGKGLFQIIRTDLENRYFNNEYCKTFYTREEAAEYVSGLIPEEFYNYSITEKDIEHREKWSMGHGYYLGHSKYSGWQVAKAYRINEENRAEILIKLQIAAAQNRYFIPVAEDVKEEAAQQPATPGKVSIIDYSEKAIAVIGDTYPIKGKLKELGGRFNKFLSCGAGWIFRKADLEIIKAALTEQTNLLPALNPDACSE